MVNSIEDIIELHKSSGKIEDAYVKIHLDEKILNLNLFTMQITPIHADREDVEIWQNRINQEIKKDRALEKEINEFIAVFEFLNKMKIRSGEIKKSECPDFIINRNDKTTIGVEVTKIYVGYDWMLEKIANEITKYKFKREDIEGYIEYKKAGDKVETYKVKSGKLIISPKLFPKMNEEYQINIKNKILEKLRKQIDEYCKCDINIVYAYITSPEYFDEITDLDEFSKELQYYMAHLEANLTEEKYKLVLKINQRWIEFDLSEGTYTIV